MTEAFGRDDLLVFQSGRRHQAGVDGRPPRCARAVGPGDQHRAGTALSLGTPLLASGVSSPAKPFQERDVAPDITQGALAAVDHHVRVHLLISCPGGYTLLIDCN